MFSFWTAFLAEATAGYNYLTVVIYFEVFVKCPCTFALVSYSYCSRTPGTSLSQNASDKLMFKQMWATQHNFNNLGTRDRKMYNSQQTHTHTHTHHTTHTNKQSNITKTYRRIILTNYLFKSLFIFEFVKDVAEENYFLWSEILKSWLNLNWVVGTFYLHLPERKRNLDSTDSYKFHDITSLKRTSFEFSNICHYVVGCYLMSPDVTGCYLMLPDITGCYRILPDVPWCYRMLPDVTGCYLMLPDITWCYRMLPNVSDVTGCYLMLPDVRFLVLPALISFWATVINICGISLGRLFLIFIFTYSIIKLR